MKLLHLFRPIALAAVLAITGQALAQPAESPGGTSAPRDTKHLARDLPPGTIVVNVRDQNGQPRPGQSVTLRIRRQSPAIGEKITTRNVTSDTSGEAIFANLETHSEYSYAAEIPFQGALYGPDYASLQPDAGLRITVHTFPTTRRLDEAQVATAALVAIEPSDSVFQLEFALDVINVGRVTWLPEDYVIHLPSGAKAFDPWERTTGRDAADEGTLRFEQRGPVAALVGTVRPGDHRAGFRFQLPSPGYRFLPWEQSEVARFEFGLPPRVARMTVLSDQAPGMRLLVPGFPDPRVTQGSSGRPVLATAWAASGEQDRLPGLRVTLSGVMTRGTMPFFSVLATAMLLVWGFLGFRGNQQQGPAPEDVEQAKTRLLDELWALEQALAKGQIGPKTHSAARRAVIAALARLESPPKKSQRGAKRARRPRSSRAPRPAS